MVLLPAFRPQNGKYPDSVATGSGLSLHMLRSGGQIGPGGAADEPLSGP